MNNPIVSTKAIALRIYPFSRTSRMVTWLSPAYGRLVTSIKGACRPKSAFLGQFDIACSCELLFYLREREGVHLARAANALDQRLGLRHDWRAAMAAAYLCDLTSRIAQPMLEAHETFFLLSETLTLLDQAATIYHKNSAARPAEAHAQPRLGPHLELLEHLVIAFELRLLHLLGFAPNFDPCPQCGEPLAEGDRRFGLTAGKLICRHVPSRDREVGSSVALDAPLLATLRRLQRGINNGAATLPHRAIRAALRANQSTTPTQNLAIGIRRFLGMLLHVHLEVPLTSRQNLFAWFSEPQIKIEWNKQ